VIGAEGKSGLLHPVPNFQELLLDRPNEFKRLSNLNTTLLCPLLILA
jgi:hypothetical protein